MSTLKIEHQDHKSIKVKVFYTLSRSRLTRLTTFTLDNHDDTISDYSSIPIPLKTCLWSICSSSPDIICRDHDLSVYTANFQETRHSLSEQHSDSTHKRDSLIWEGHGLLTWIMDQSDDELVIYGKPFQTETDPYLEIFLELQPTMKWQRDSFFSALRSKSFEQFRATSQIPSHSLCNCYIASEENNVYLRNPPVSPPPSLSKVHDTEFDRYLRQRSHIDNENQGSPPIPSRLPSLSSSVPVFRPEPVFPPASPAATATSTATNVNLNEFATKRPRLLSPTKPYYNSTNEDHHRQQQSSHSFHNDMALPMPSISYPKRPESSRRSAFTLASLSDKEPSRHLPPNSSSSNSSSGSPPTHHHSSYSLCNELDSNNEHASIIPVVYTPSNKKRKKPIAMMPSEKNNIPLSSESAYSKLQQAHPSSQSTQQQVNTAVRTYYEVDKDSKGEYILPVEIDSWTVVDLGTVIYDRPAYHNQRYIYPANYTVRKWYRSMIDPKSDTQYTCRILENGREPKFEVTADDCPMTYSGPTPTTVWTIIVRRAFAIRNQEYGHNPVGPDFFGLRKNTIAKMIQDLPNASKCSQYIWQTFEPARFNKPGRNRRRADSSLPSSLLGGVNYGLTSSRLINTNLTPTQQSYHRNSTDSQADEKAKRNESPRLHRRDSKPIETV
ncbi:hypothetical protein BD560DRAFT_386718 [Blakeslea trispora]|nr:hypothetical protein BD560DRAFT_386718 [Blakeslea trispora]